MSRVLMAWEFGGGLGHLMRLKPLAAALLESGCEVWLIARDAAKARTVLDPEHHHRLHVRPAPQLPRPAPTPGTGTETLADVLIGTGLRDRDSIFAAANRWFRLLHEIKPDLVISDFSPVCNFVARRRIPVVVVGNGYTVPPRLMPCRPIRPWQDAPTEASRLAETSLVREFNVLARANQMDGIDGFAVFSMATRRSSARSGSWTRMRDGVASPFGRHLMWGLSKRLYHGPNAKQGRLSSTCPRIIRDWRRLRPRCTGRRLAATRTYPRAPARQSNLRRSANCGSRPGRWSSARYFPGHGC